MYTLRDPALLPFQDVHSARHAPRHAVIIIYDSSSRRPSAVAAGFAGLFVHCDILSLFLIRRPADRLQLLRDCSYIATCRHYL
jgi:hypothetical protein